MKPKRTHDDHSGPESEAFIQSHVAALLHDELGVVVAKTWQQLSGSPLQEVVEGVGGTLLHPDLIPVTPDLQTSQRNADVQRTVELKQTEERRLGSSSTADLLVYWEVRGHFGVSPSPPGWPHPACGRLWSYCSSGNSETVKNTNVSIKIHTNLLRADFYFVDF